VRAFRNFLRFFFRHFYTTLAWSYDLVASVVSVGQWNEWIRSVLDPSPTEPVLEIAHGPGHLLLELSQKDFKAVGVDASRQMCRMASHRLMKAGFASKVVQARAQALPFSDGTFATLLSTFPTEFILDPVTLSEAYRALEPGGQYRIVPMAEIRGSGFLDQFAAWLFRITGQYADLLPSWTDPLSDVGFEVRREDVLLDRSRVIRLVGTRVQQMESQVA
jgi:ubiquinone/menaquinone biosynthesis C-methylase UbiE